MKASTRSATSKTQKKERRASRAETLVRRPSLADQPIDYKDAEFLKKFMTERGKIVPARFTGLPAKKQRQLKRAIRRARVMGLVP